MKRAVWNSPKGYSKPDEIVRVEVVKGSKARITSQPDAGEGEKQAASYWVDVSELIMIHESGEIEMSGGDLLDSVFGFVEGLVPKPNDSPNRVLHVDLSEHLPIGVFVEMVTAINSVVEGSQDLDLKKAFDRGELGLRLQAALGVVVEDEKE
jgi:hypothetical protein